MQLTKLDHWLKQRFIHETHIFTMRLPKRRLPFGVSKRKVDAQKRGDYTKKLIVRNNKTAEKVLELLKKEQIMYATHVVEGKHWYNNLIAPVGKSFTYQTIGRVALVLTLCYAAYGLYLLSQDEKLMKTVKETIYEFRFGW